MGGGGENYDRTRIFASQEEPSFPCKRKRSEKRDKKKKAQGNDKSPTGDGGGIASNGVDPLKRNLSKCWGIYIDEKFRWGKKA